jgi:hypothetical protein
MSTRTNEHLASYASTLTSNNPAAVDHLSELQAGITAATGLSADTSGAYAISILGGLTARESAIGGINDAFVVATAITVLGLLFSLFLSRSKKRPGPTG